MTSRVIGLTFAAIMTAAAQPGFEVASVKLLPPGGEGFTSLSASGALRFTASRVSLRLLISLAFGVDSDRIEGKLPEDDLYDVAAQPSSAAQPSGNDGLTYDQLKQPLKQLLEDRFKLATHRITRDVPGYALVVSGPTRLEPGKSKTPQASILKNGLRCRSTTIQTFAAMLSRPAGRPVIDSTGIAGRYDISLDYAPEGVPDSPLPSVFTAVRESTGLKLVPQKVPMDILVIDHVERVPTEN